jgi:hypothetical protein
VQNELLLKVIENEEWVVIRDKGARKEMIDREVWRSSIWNIKL